MSVASGSRFPRSNGRLGGVAQTRGKTSHAVGTLSPADRDAIALIILERSNETAVESRKNFCTLTRDDESMNTTRKYLAFDIETAKVLPEDLRLALPPPPRHRLRRHAPCRQPRADPLARRRPCESRRPDEPGGSRRPGPLPEDRTKEGYTLLTWNGLGFDLDILAEESGLLDMPRPGDRPRGHDVPCLLPARSRRRSRRRRQGHGARREDRRA